MNSYVLFADPESSTRKAGLLWPFSRRLLGLSGKIKTTVLFLAFGLSLSGLDALADQVGSGIAIYTTLDHGPDETAKAVAFSRAEKHQFITKLTTRDGKTLRVTNNQLKRLVYLTDLSRATVVDEGGLRSLKEEASDLKAIATQFPRASSLLSPATLKIEAAIQAFESGNVILNGRLMSRSDYLEQKAEAQGSSIDLELGQRTYSGAKLQSISGEMISIAHSGGAFTIPIAELSEEQIGRLNETSVDLQIKRSETVVSASPLQAESPSSVPPVAQRSKEMSARVRQLDETEMTRVTRDALEEIALRIFRERLQVEQFASEKGWGFKERSVEEIYEFNTRGLIEIEDYEKTMLAADYAIDTFGITLSGKSAMKAARVEWSEATESEAREAAREKMRAILEREAGVDLIELASSMSKQDLRAGLGRDTVVDRYEAFAISERSRMISSFRPVCRAANIDESLAEAIHFFFTSLDIRKRNEVYEALEVGREIETLVSEKLPAYHEPRAKETAAVISKVGQRPMLIIETLVLSRGDLINISSYDSPLRQEVERE